MSRSGVAVAPECIELFDDLKLKKNLQYIIYGLNPNKTQIVVLNRSEKGSEGPEATYEEFVGELPESQCRWAVYDFQFELTDGGKRDKILFISWAPDTAPIREKMVFSSSKDALRRALNGIAIEVQGTDFSEVSFETVLDKAQKGR